jgi:2-oxoglutarate ferredoxin oxidoreductase subunit beta
MLASGATYIARGYTKKMDQLKTLIEGGIAHRGFSVIDVLQICATFFPATDYYTPRIYDLQDHDPSSFDLACAKAREWDYNGDARIALGLFYRATYPGFAERMAYTMKSPDEQKKAVRDLLASRV